MKVAGLPTNFAHQLEQAPALRKLGYAVVEGHQKGEFTRANNLALVLFYRSLQTHEAAEILVRKEMVEDARVLVRVLVEEVVNCAYMLTVADDEVANDFIDYPKYWENKIVLGLKNTDESRLRNSVSLEQEEEIRAKYEALHPRFKDRRGEWCADGPLHHRAAKVDARFTEMLERAYVEYRWLVNSEWRFASSHVHAMADSLLDQVTHADGVITIEQKFDPVDAAAALYSANFALALVLSLVDNALGGRYAVDILSRSREFNGHPADSLTP